MVDTLVCALIASIDISIDNSDDQWYTRYTNVITSYKQKRKNSDDRVGRMILLLL